MTEESLIVEQCPKCEGQGVTRLPMGMYAICEYCDGECYIQHECPIREAREDRINRIIGEDE